MDQWIRTDKKMEIVERVAENGVPYLYFPALEGIGVRHAFSTKEGGVSTGVYESMNLSFTKQGRKGKMSLKITDEWLKPLVLEKILLCFLTKRTQQMSCR